MGKSTKRKRAEAEEKAIKPLLRLVQNNKDERVKAATVFDPIQPIRAYVELYGIRPIECFIPRTKSSNPHNRLMEAVRYAFNRYKTPSFLSQVWDAAPGTVYQTILGPKLIDYRDWYIALATGKSLYKECTKGLLTKQESHLFATCPFNLSITGAIWYAVIRAMDVGVSLSRKIAETKLCDKRLDEFWRSVARWFSLHETTRKEMNDLLDYISYRHGESLEWHVKDHTLASLQRRMHSWHRELGRSSTLALAYPEWKGIAVPDSSFTTGRDAKKYVWKFHQITTGKRLAEEGNKQRHCVSGYAAQCASGACSIWSLTAWDVIGNGVHALTLEVRSDKVVQIRGKANRSATAGEMNVVKVWAQKSGFSLASTNGW